jgi:hypothetical protein
MPLNTQKTQHILNVVAKTFAGRQRTVVLVSLAGGVYSYATLSAIMRPEELVDPQIQDASGQQPHRVADMLMVAPLGTNFTGVVFVADTTSPTASAVAAAPKYEVVEALPVGIIPGGSHLRVLLRRLR